MKATACALLAGAALLAGCPRTVPTPPPPGPAAAPAFAERLPSLPVENAARVADGLYRGGQPDAAGLRALRDLGVRTIVNLRSGHSEREEAEALGMEVVEIPMVAAVDSDPPTDDQVRRFLEVVLDPARRPVFFHCARGKDRTGTMAAVYRIEVDGWTNERALAEMRHFGFHGWYADLERFVRDYRPRGAAPPAGR